MKSPRQRSSRTTRITREEATRIATESLQDVVASLRLRISPVDLVVALEDLHRDDSAVDLPARDRAFWAEHAGITSDTATVARGSGHNAAAQVLMDSSSLTAAEAAENLRLSPSTVRHYKAERKLYSYLANGRLLFPTWQFTQSGRPLPGLERILARLPEDLHPQAVAGFFLTPQPDLVINGAAVSAAAWMEAGGSVEPVLAMAGALAAGY